ncbi:hypothetical protein VYU27_009809 [Nannochloropsis oceanica]
MISEGSSSSSGSDSGSIPAGYQMEPEGGGDEIFRTGLPPIHWTLPDSATSSSPSSGAIKDPTPSSSPSKTSKRKNVSPSPPIKGALPNKSKSVGSNTSSSSSNPSSSSSNPSSSSTSSSSSGGGGSSSSSSNSKISDGVNRNIYPSHAHAAVAITIATRPSAFDQTIRYCIVKRSKDPGKGKWSLPGGSVELGEEILSAAAREAREETGLTHEDLRFYPYAVCTTDAIYWREKDADGKREKEVQFHYVITHQAAWITTGAVERARAGDDAAEVAFKTLEELKTMTLDGTLVGSVCDVVMRVERLVSKGVINVEFDLVTLEA